MKTKEYTTNIVQYSNTPIETIQDLAVEELGRYIGQLLLDYPNSTLTTTMSHTTKQSIETTHKYTLEVAIT